MLRSKISRLIVPIVVVAIGCLWVVVGMFKYGWIVGRRPTSGFFPITAGFLLVVVGILAVFSERKLDSPTFILQHLYPLMSMVAITASALLIGFFPSLSIYMLVWIRFYEKYSWRVSIFVTIVTIALMYGIFRMWLRVPFPTGLIMKLGIGSS